MNDLIFISIGLLFCVFFINNNLLFLYAVAFMSMVASGIVVYFTPSLSYVSWTTTTMGFAAIGKLIFSFSKIAKSKIPLYFLFMIFFILTSFLSIIESKGNIYEFIAAIKNIFQFWTIPLIMLVAKFDRKETKSIIKLIMWIAVIQVPISVIQYYFYVDYAHRVAPGDSIVGAFGGSESGGGNSGALTTFLSCMIFAIASLYINKSLSFIKTIFFTIVLLIPILLNETKVFFVYTIIGVLVLVLCEIKKSFLKSSAMFVLITLLTFTVLSYYYTSLQHVETYSDRSTSITQYLTRNFAGQISRDSSHVNRITGLAKWYKFNSFDKNAYSFLLGHGLGSSKDSGLFQGHIAKDPKYSNAGIGSTTLSMMLWDLGVFGTFQYLLLFIVGIFSAYNCYKKINEQCVAKALMLSCMISCIFFVICIFYHTYLVSAQALNFFSMFVLGAIAHCKNNESFVSIKI